MCGYHNECLVCSVVRLFSLGLELQTAATAASSRTELAQRLASPHLARLFSFAGSKAVVPVGCQKDWSSAVLTYLLGPRKSQIGPNGVQVQAELSEGGREAVVYLQSEHGSLVSSVFFLHRNYLLESYHLHRHASTKC